MYIFHTIVYNTLYVLDEHYAYKTQYIADINIHKSIMKLILYTFQGYTFVVCFVGLFHIGNWNSWLLKS